MHLASTERVLQQQDAEKKASPALVPSLPHRYVRPSNLKRTDHLRGVAATL
ncbi:hypothetical protein PC128_g24134 [Phytophthora cactorum]|nr:hypothetical protein PC128_g24134 [Phytophthora cactorum]